MQLVDLFFFQNAYQQTTELCLRTRCISCRVLMLSHSLYREAGGCDSTSFSTERKHSAGEKIGKSAKHSINFKNTGRKSRRKVNVCINIVLGC